MDKKIRLAIQCLYIQAGLTIFFYMVSVSQYLDLKSSLDPNAIPGPISADLGYSYLSTIGLLPLLIAIGCIYAARELRNKTKWSWAMALSAFLFTTSGVGIIVSIIGAAYLLSREVREHFLKEMDLSLD